MVIYNYPGGCFVIAFLAMTNVPWAHMYMI